MMQRNKVGSAPTHLNRFFFVVVIVFFIIGIIAFPLGIFRIANGRLSDEAEENHDEPFRVAVREAPVPDKSYWDPTASACSLRRSSCTCSDHRNWSSRSSITCRRQQRCSKWPRERF